MANEFAEHLLEAVRKFPNLAIIETSSSPILKGVLDIPDGEQRKVDSYMIEVHPSREYPKRFPNLFEVGGSIPKEPDWHINADGSCCVTVLPKEIIFCQTGITLVQFLVEQAIPYFANQTHRRLTGRYLNGEYSHGKKGLFESYESMFKTSDTNIWKYYCDIAFHKIALSTGRNEPCICNSGMKYKDCHYQVFHRLRIIGENTVNQHLNYIIS